MASTILPSPTLPHQRSWLDLGNSEYDFSISPFNLDVEDKEYEFSIPSFDEFKLDFDQGPEPLIASPAHDESEWVSGVKLLNIIVAVTLVCLLMLLDSSIIVTAVPRITSDFHSLPDVGWYGSAYQLARYAVVTFFVDWLVDMVLAQRFNHLPESFT